MRQLGSDRISQSAPTPSRPTPRTRRGELARERLVRAARSVFERDGYVDARLGDITAEAGMAAGSFYTYFSSKEEIFTAVFEALQEEMLHPALEPIADHDDPVAVIAASNRAYLLAYRRNAKLMRLLEQVATVDSAFAELRLRRNEAFTRRNARSISELQARGLADARLDPLAAAAALSAMVSRSAYNTFVLGERWKLDDLVDTLTRLWANALRIPTAE